MDQFEQAFRTLPDTVIITDAYWYIIDFNRESPFGNLKKGRNLTNYMPDCKTQPRDRYAHGGRVFKRAVSPVNEGGAVAGYVVYLADITEKERLTELRRRKSEELTRLVREQAQANAELEEYVRQAEALNDVGEQVRIARAIHDNDGHTITALNTISRMCMMLRDSDPAEFRRLIAEGTALCRRTAEEQDPAGDRPLPELLEDFRRGQPFPVDLSVAGEEPDFAAPLHEVILRICREAYHNTLSHSLADRLTIEAQMTADSLTLHIRDNGSFHGTLEKGYGLTAMEENVTAAGGTLTFETEEGKGFGITAEWRKAR